MRRLLVAPLLLAIAACTGATKARVGEAPNAVAVAPQPVPVPVTAPPSAPPGAVVVWYADPRCTPSLTRISLPDPTRAECLMREARLAILRIVQREKLQPGPESPCYRYRSPEYESCLDFAARSLPGLGYGFSGRWVSAHIGAKPFAGCVAGMSTSPIFVSLAEPERVDSLTAWEAANNWLTFIFGTMALADGPLVSEATNAALAACGVN